MIIIMVNMECSACGVPYAISKTFHTKVIKDGKEWFCPSGHSQFYGETELDKVKKKLQNTEWTLKQKENTATYYRMEAEGYKNSASALKGVITKMKKRAQVKKTE